jgi:hypothetical protein
VAGLVTAFYVFEVDHGDLVTPFFKTNVLVHAIRFKFITRNVRGAIVLLGHAQGLDGVKLVSAPCRQETGQQCNQQ